MDLPTLKVVKSCPVKSRKLLNGQYRAHLSRNGHAFPHTVHVVGQVAQPDLYFCPDYPDRAEDQVSRHLDLNAKHMFDAGPDAGSSTVSPLLPLGQLPVPAAFSLKMLTVSALFQLGQCLFGPVRGVRPYVPAGIRLVKQFSKHPAVMNRGIGHRIVANQFVHGVDADVVLVSERVFFGAGGPSRMDVLLPAFRFVPIFGNIAFFDEGVLLGCSAGWVRI